jgi:hypothetical protein
MQLADVLLHRAFDGEDFLAALFKALKGWKLVVCDEWHQQIL